MRTTSVTLDDIEALAVGAWILGTGGGGSPYLGLLNMRRLYADGHRVELMSPFDLEDDDRVAVVSNMGAPLVGQERLADSRNIARAVAMQEEYSGVKFRAVMSLEIGGGNGIQPLMAAAHLGLPVVDADLMGRAYPEAQMTSAAVGDLRPFPCALYDPRGLESIVTNVPNWKWMERVSRKICVEMGSIASTCKAPRSGREVKEWGIHFTVSKAIGIGRRVREAQRLHDDPIAAILDEAEGKQLFRGKVVDVARRATEGFLRGRCAIEGLDEDRGAKLEIAFQNEWVVAWRDGSPIAMSPDLICVLDTVSGNAFGAETIRYGMRVTVVALPAPPVFLTPKGLDHVGPRAFGYDLDFKSVFDAAPINPSPPFRGEREGTSAERWEDEVGVSASTLESPHLTPTLSAPGGGEGAITRAGNMRRIGIDVGGTNTDAVLLADGRVVHAVKTPTTADVTGGIVAALALLTRHPEVARGRIDGVVIGTTHFVNAVVQRRHLSPVAAIRIGLPASASLPPFCDWPPDLAAIVGGRVFMLEGGHEYDGREFMPFDEAGMRAAARQIRDGGIRSVGIAASFSPLDPAHEERARTILAEECPEASITLSHDLGRIGLLERENAALLNAALVDLARVTIAGFRDAIMASHIEAPLYITQNDGTVMSAETAMALPVMSFASGATNSMRGAAFLSGLDDAMVVDVGGTSTDVGQLRRGFPREANSVVEIGEVRTLFRMPDLFSIGLGGGSIVNQGPPARTLGPPGRHAGGMPAVQVGPQSVGYRLTEEALVFGGNTLTATDAAVAAGIVRIGDPAKAAGVPRELAQAVLDLARAKLEDTIDRMKTEAGDVPLIAVGGGAFLVPEKLAGVSEVIRVEHGDCANAVGAAIAQISGETDQVYRDMTREAAIAAAEAQAVERAVAAGADRTSLQTVDVEDMPLAYLPGNALRVRVRVAGEMQAPALR